MTRSHWLRAMALASGLMVATAGCKKETAGTPGTPGAPGTPAAADQSTPKAAVKSAAAALKAGDTATVKTMVTGTDAQMKALDYMTPMFAAMQKLSDAAAAKFGKDNEISKDWKDMAAEADAAEEKIDGDKATLTKKDDPKPTKLEKKNGKWMVSLDDMPDMKEDQAKTMTKIANDVAGDISSGKITTAAAAKEELQKRMVQAMTPATPTAPGIPPVPGAPK